MYLPVNCFHPGSLASCVPLWEGLAILRERRKRERYKLALPVQFNDGSGTTRDISTSGIFLETKDAYAIGDTIQLSVKFKNETLQCEGRVLRVEPRNGQFGVAVELNSYIFS